MNIKRWTVRNVLISAALLGALSGCLDKAEVVGNTTAVPPTTSGNSAPVISGNPQQAVVAGNSYTFTPQASDPDGDALTFSIQNLPIWATFNTNSGNLSGSPTLVDIGSFANIVISVSDGQLSSNLPAFGVDVSQVSLGSASLTWTAPNQNSNGTTLTDLSGFRVYYGTSSNALSSFVEFNSPNTTTVLIDNLVPNTYFFGATALNANGIESSLSNIVSKVVQ